MLARLTMMFGALALLLATLGLVWRDGYTEWRGGHRRLASAWRWARSAAA